MAAYRPIVIRVQATATTGAAIPPFVTLDIYIDNVYYKSSRKTVPISKTDVFSTWEFDISDAMQEYLGIDLPDINNTDVAFAQHSSASVFVKCRSSDIDINNFTVDEPTVPVQGTKFTDPISGTGLQSNSFFVINAALQHEDNQNLETHLSYYKQGEWADTAFPLTHRKRYFFCNDSNDNYPLVYKGNCVNADIVLNYRLKGQTAFLQATALNVNVCNGITFEVETTANQVSVHLDTAPVAGGWVVVQHKKHTDSVWITASSGGQQQFNSQDISFNVSGEDLAGDYDIRVISFCSACISADPILGTFTLDGTMTNLRWRGINPFCVQQTFEDDVYITIEKRNEVSDGGIFFPNDTLKFSKETTTTADLYVKFFSDHAHLSPLNLIFPGLTIFVKRTMTEVQEPGSINQVVEGMESYTIDANGTEALLSNVTTRLQSESYGPYPTVTSSQDQQYSWSVFPTDLIVNGNTGQRGYANLQQYNLDTDIATGVTKPNTVDDPDYIAPGPDVITCPIGPTIVIFQYNGNMNLIKAEVMYDGSVFLEGTPVADTQSGGYAYIMALPPNKVATVTVKARDLRGSPGPNIGVKVNWIDLGGVAQEQTYNVPNNIETTIAATFPNIRSISISTI